MHLSDQKRVSLIVKRVRFFRTEFGWPLVEFGNVIRELGFMSSIIIKYFTGANIKLKPMEEGSNQYPSTK